MFSNYGVDLNCVQNYLRGAIFVVLRDFARNWALAIARKSGVSFMSSMISPKLLHEIGRECSRFFGPNPPCWQCLLVSQVALIKKLQERNCDRH